MSRRPDKPKAPTPEVIEPAAPPPAAPRRAARAKAKQEAPVAPPLAPDSAAALADAAVLAAQIDQAPTAPQATAPQDTAVESFVDWSAPDSPKQAAAPARARRLLIATHSHPAISKGGAEIAAWRVFESFRAHPLWDAYFLGCGRDHVGGRLGSVITQPFGADQFLYASHQFDWFKFSNMDERFPREFAELLRNTRPDILHFHHYVNFGMEAFLIAKRELPDVKIVLTLHEFQAICNHFGQMVTKQTKSLCYASGLRDCNKCFPEIRPADFFLRKSYIMRFMEMVDHFISPSRFLADRYIDWGIPAEKMSVIENVIAAAQAPAIQPDRAATGPLRVGFFGQISYLKGIHVLLEAAAMLENEEIDDVVFDIHGDYTNQPAEFQTDFLARLAKAGSNVRFHGPYDNTRVDGLMRAVDVVLVPSIWWENSPVVIQECLRNRRPIIASNIGGMAEKVRPGLDGWHFNVGNPLELGALLRDLAADRDRIAAMHSTMRYPPSADEVVAAHLEIFDRLAPA